MIGTAFAAIANPLSVILVMVTGAASILVAITGFCVVGNVLKRFGFTPKGDAARPEVV